MRQYEWYECPRRIGIVTKHHAITTGVSDSCLVPIPGPGFKYAAPIAQRSSAVCVLAVLMYSVLDITLPVRRGCVKHSSNRAGYLMR